MATPRDVRRIGYRGKLLSADVGDREPEWRVEGLDLRNPWRFSFDGETGDLWIADVGQGDWEEIDFLPAESPGLESYGWDVSREPTPSRTRSRIPAGGSSPR